MSKNNKNTKKRTTKLRIDDTVLVIAGKDKGKYGSILIIDKKKEKVVVQGINRVKRFQPPTQENPKGGEILLERPIDLSNVMYYDSKARKGRRLGFKYKSESSEVKKTKIRVMKIKGKREEILKEVKKK